jgi:hypothetical protein
MSQHAKPDEGGAPASSGTGRGKRGPSRKGYVFIRPVVRNYSLDEVVGKNHSMFVEAAYRVDSYSAVK